MPKSDTLKLVTDYITKKSNLDRYTVEASRTDAYRRALSEADKVKAITKYLYERVTAKLSDAGATLDDIIQDDNLLKQFNQSVRLKYVLQYHDAVKNRTQHAAGAHSSQRTTLETISRIIFDKRDSLWEQSMDPSATRERQLFNFVLLVRDEFKKTGHSPREVFEPNNQGVFSRYFTTGRLGLAMAIYKHLIQPQPELEQADGLAEINPDDLYRQQARDLAKDAAKEGQGLVTALGAEGLKREEVRQRARQAMFQHHPDRNPEGDAELFGKAAALAQLIDKGVFDEYDDELRKFRRGGDGPEFN